MRSQSRAEVSSVRDFWFVRLMQKERWHAPPFYKYKHFINHDLVNHDFLLIGDIYTFGKFYCFVAGYFYLFNQCAGDVLTTTPPCTPYIRVSFPAKFGVSIPVAISSSFQLDMNIPQPVGAGKVNSEL